MLGFLRRSPVEPQPLAKGRLHFEARGKSVFGPSRSHRGAVDVQDVAFDDDLFDGAVLGGSVDDAAVGPPSWGAMDKADSHVVDPFEIDGLVCSGHVDDAPAPGQSGEVGEPHEIDGLVCSGGFDSSPQTRLSTDSSEPQHWGHMDVKEGQAVAPEDIEGIVTDGSLANDADELLLIGAFGTSKSYSPNHWGHMNVRAGAVQEAEDIDGLVTTGSFEPAPVYVPPRASAYAPSAWGAMSVENGIMDSCDSGLDDCDPGPCNWGAMSVVGGRVGPEEVDGAFTYDDGTLVVQLYELQRRPTLIQQWHSPSLPHDVLQAQGWRWVDLVFRRHPWLTGDRRESAASDVPPILPGEGWTQRSFEVCTTDETDPNGWQYSHTFTNREAAWVRQATGRFCRRRLWTGYFDVDHAVGGPGAGAGGRLLGRETRATRHPSAVVDCVDCVEEEEDFLSVSSHDSD